MSGSGCCTVGRDEDGSRLNVDPCVQQQCSCLSVRKQPHTAVASIAGLQTKHADCCSPSSTELSTRSACMPEVRRSLLALRKYAHCGWHNRDQLGYDVDGSCMGHVTVSRGAILLHLNAGCLPGALDSSHQIGILQHAATPGAIAMPEFAVPIRQAASLMKSGPDMLTPVVPLCGTNPLFKCFASLAFAFPFFFSFCPHLCQEGCQIAEDV